MGRAARHPASPERDPVASPQQEVDRFGIADAERVQRWAQESAVIAERISDDRTTFRRRIVWCVLVTFLSIDIAVAAGVILRWSS